MPDRSHPADGFRRYRSAGDTAGHAVRTEHVHIPMDDGVRLAATLYVPDGPGPFPAILESIPYRKDDWTLSRDWPLHGAFAAAGYVSCRLDVRGTGSSEGIAEGEYTEREILDNLAVIDWLATRDWSAGGVGMFGISWGGFSALQAAARRPPALRAIIPVHFSHDRYNLDVHYVGGTLHVGESVYWPVEMVGENALPPDPERFGPGWRDEWLRRLEATPQWPLEWLRHQRRDSFWRAASVGEEWAAIQAPVLAIGGLNDGYRDAVLAVLEHVRAPRRGVIGPWGHAWPHEGSPGPSIDGVGLMRRWWDRWLKGEATGADPEPMLSLYVVEPPGTAEFPAELPGRWWHIGHWPPVLRIAPPPPLYLEGDGAAGLGSLTGEPAASGDAATSTWAGPPDVGLCAPFWCGYGYPPQGVPGDQRADDARSLLFTSPPLERPILVAGIPRARLWLSADQPVAQVAVRLEAVAPDGRSALIARAVRNLTRLDPAAEAPVPLVPGEPVEVDLPLSAAGARIPAGHRLRVAVAGAAFPIAWPTPTPVALTLHHDVARPSALRLPTAAGWSSEHAPDLGRPAFDPPASEPVPGIPAAWRIERDGVAGTTSLVCESGGGDRFPEREGLVFAADARYRVTVADGFAECRADGTIRYRLAYPHGPEVVADAGLTLDSDRDELRIRVTLAVTEDNGPVFDRTWELAMPRDLL
jgi:putative CocE/NonD family hydrolase